MKEKDAVGAGVAMAIYYPLMALVLVGEIAGPIHAFSKHGTGDGVLAICLPPWAWYRTVEWLWHEDETSEASASTSSPALERQMHKGDEGRVELAKADKDDMRALEATMSDAVNVRDAILSGAGLTEIKELASVGIGNAERVTQDVLIKLDPSYPDVWKRNVIGYFEEVNKAADAGDIARLRYSDTVFTHYVEWARARFPEGIVKTKTRRTHE